jgi:P2-related tail formation protein
MFKKNLILLHDVNPVECLQQIVSAYTDYMKVVEQEQTKRQEINTWEKTTIARIHSQRDLLMAYLERSFDERAENFRTLFAMVEWSLDTGNNEQLALVLHSITELAKSSPFKELASLASVQAALGNPDHEWEF